MPYWSPLGARTELATRQALLRAAKALAAKAEAKKKRKGKLWASVQESLDLLADTQAEWQALENQAEMTHQRAPRVRSRQALEIHHTTQEADGSQHSEAWWQALGNRREGLPEGAEGSEGAQGAIEAWHLEVERQAHANRGESHFESDEGAKGAHDEAEVEVQENVRFPGGGSRVKPGAVFPPWVSLPAALDRPSGSVCSLGKGRKYVMDLAEANAHMVHEMSPRDIFFRSWGSQLPRPSLCVVLYCAGLWCAVLWRAVLPGGVLLMAAGARR